MDGLFLSREVLQATREAVGEANALMKQTMERREVAVNALIDYAVSAYAEGRPITEIMDDVQFVNEPGPNEPPPAIAQMFGMQTGDERPAHHRFAEWLANNFASRIIERYDAEHAE